MVIVLEGACGTGKTTLAEKLSAELKWPVYRPFRNDGDGHAPGEQDPRLKLLPNFPINSWQEDLYTADVLAATKPNLILDRSLPSGMAYASGMSQEQVKLAVELWTERLVRAGTLAVLLEAPPAIRLERAQSRRGVAGEAEHLQQTFFFIGRRTSLRNVVINTAVADQDATARLVMQATRVVG